MKVLFVCTGNICRSPMAEAIARHLGKRRGLDIEFASAGTHAIVGSAATYEARQVMGELEIPLRWHSARQLSAGLVADADLTVALNTDHEAYVRRHFPEARLELLDEVPDPYGYDLEVYRAARDQIAAAIEERLGGWAST